MATLKGLAIMIFRLDLIAALGVPSPDPSSLPINVSPASPAVSTYPVVAPAMEPFIQRFLTSAGAGGLAALLAAIIAALIARAQLSNTKRQQRHDRWWDTLSWVYDRAVVEGGKREALSHIVTFTMLTELAQRANEPPGDSLQAGTVSSILSMFQPSSRIDRSEVELPIAKEAKVDDTSVDRNGPDQADAEHISRHNAEDPGVGVAASDNERFQVTDPAAIDLMGEVRSAVRLSGSVSVRDSGLLYEQELRSSLLSFQTILPVVAPDFALLVGDKHHRTDPFDFIVLTNKETILVESIYRFKKIEPSHLRRRVLSAVEYLRTGPPDARFLIVSNHGLTSPVNAEFKEISGERIDFLRWRGEGDNRQLLSAIVHRSPFPSVPDND
ncbi:hypothetical protein [Actinoplanes sp. NPDC049265]|uniref:hypothetical protein n=1 Tax=Actinoplanes sp. NPDC049265 TaxID=3363902 RepID=UPI00371B6021